MLSHYQGAETILVADDEPVVRSIAKIVLRNHGYNVLLAEDGEQALQLHQANGTVDLLVTDVVMPRMTGPELVNALKQERTDLLCIMMSGYHNNQLKDIKEVCAYLQKPFTPESLLKVVRKTLDNRSSIKA
jgi:two-component system, cell cycle sensor histidine kinase and response regulator CckA